MHPGNFLFMDDGRLGLIDFGCMLEIDDTLWDLFRKMELPLTTGRRDERLAVLREWSWITDAPAACLRAEAEGSRANLFPCRVSNSGITEGVYAMTSAALNSASFSNSSNSDEAGPV